MSDPPAGPDEGERELAALLDYLQRTRGLDLSGYKRPGLLRRLAKRLRLSGIDGFAAYIDHLESNPTEYVRLLDTLLINVTAFFRDDLPWEYVGAEVIPRIMAQKAPDEAIRVWCAGCATGEEAYTLAIVLAEAVGEEALRERVKIYATDLDESALVQARLGAYTERDVADMPPPLLEKYFERRDQSFVFRKDLRRAIIFGRNDLMQDAPISRVDLLACRNTLMYFDAPTQARILARFHFALVDGGFLLLGRAETIQTHGSLFVPVDLRRRVFTKAPGSGARPRPVLNARVPVARAAGADPQEEAMRFGAFESGVVPQFVVDRAGRLAQVNAAARGLFKLGSADLGRPLQDLEVSYRPYELRSVIEQADAEHQPVTRDAVPWRAPGGEQRWFDIVVVPLADAGGGTVGVSVAFVEVTRLRQLQQQLEDSQTELETAYQELQSTNEELETTNEELHSTVEELETTNEELQSTNEELETMNEELQSTNEELQTINDELRTRSDELNQANSFLEAVFTSLRAGVAVLDRELRVLVWNRQAEELWGVRTEEAEGAHFLNLDIGLQVGRLMPAIRACLGGDLGGQELHLPATNRRGRPIVSLTRVFPLVSRTSDEPHGVIVLMEERPAEERPAAVEGSAPASAG
jgi:two-component system, chemotaxis family, CheB/CheR fusion protein